MSFGDTYNFASQCLTYLHIPTDRITDDESVDRIEFSNEDINKKICNILNDLNRDAGLGTIQGSHKDRMSLYCDFQFRRE